MYRCILAPVDGTAFGEHALPHAAAIARRAGATLHLAHVHVPQIVPSGAEHAVLPGAWAELGREQESGYLEGLAEKLAAAHDIRVQTTLLMRGEVAQALEDYAVECGAGLVVMSTHGHAGLSRLWHHGVADQVTHDLPLPVLLIRPEDESAEPDLAMEPEVRHILLPLDGSPDAEAMLEHAVALGRTFGARYTLLRVVRPESTLGAALLGQDGHQSHHQMVREQTVARQYLGALAERMRAAGLDVHTHVRIATDAGSAIVEHVRAAAESPAARIDLIAMEARPHGAVSRVLATHTAETVLRQSPAPVLLFDPAPLTASTPGADPVIAVDG